MKNILIIHPEGNIANNPNLSAIAIALCELYKVFILSEKRDIFQDVKWQNAEMMFYTNFNLKYLSGINFDFIIGVDQGIIYASQASQYLNIPYALISYEIFSANEYPIYKKNKEIEACKNSSFAITQDSIRAYLLHKENHIPKEKIFYVPVAESTNRKYERSDYLHKKFNILNEKKIILYMGGIEAFTNDEDIFRYTENIPDNWVFVIHPRYGASSIKKSLLQKISSSPKIYFSLQPFQYTYELEQMVCSADIGFVFYDIFLYSPYMGKNILCIGLASGKFSTYMKYGIPVIINNTTNLANIVQKYELGFVIQNAKDINYYLTSISDIKKLKENCEKFSRKYLDFSLYKNYLLQLIENTMQGKDISGIILKSNSIIDIQELSDYRMLYIYDKMKSELTIKKQFNFYVKNMKKKLKKFIKFFIPLRILNILDSIMRQGHK